MNDVHDALERKRWEAQPAPGAFDRLVRLRRRRRRNRRITAVATALAALGLTAWATRSLVGLQGQAPRPTGPIDPGRTIVVRTVSVGPGVVAGIAATPDGLWVGTNALPGVLHLDVRTGRLIGQVKTHEFPPDQSNLHPLVSDLVSAFGSVWTVDTQFGSVTRIDPRTDHVLARIVVGGYPNAATAAAGSLWVVDGVNGTLVRINPTADRVTATASLPVRGVEDAAIAGDDASLWVTASDEVVRIDPRDPTVVTRVSVGVRARGVVVGGGAVWVIDQAAGTLSRIDPATDNVTMNVPVGGAPDAVAVGDGVVWVASDTDGTVSAVDPATGRIVLTRRVGKGPSGMVSSGSWVWVLNGIDDTITQISVGL